MIYADTMSSHTRVKQMKFKDQFQECIAWEMAVKQFEATGGGGAESQTSKFYRITPGNNRSQTYLRLC